MSEYGISWREIDAWTPRQLVMFSERLVERKRRESGKGKKSYTEKDIVKNPKLMSL